MKQVREKKRRWCGRRLGEGLAKEFGELLDYARALEFESKPDYGGLMGGFRRLVGKEGKGLDSREYFLCRHCRPADILYQH
jgi:hypothetical protein